MLRRREQGWGILNQLNANSKDFERKELLRIKELEKEFSVKYPKFEEININRNTSRQAVINRLYNLKYKEIFQTKKEFQSYVINRIKDELFDDLYKLL